MKNKQKTQNVTKLKNSKCDKSKKVATLKNSKYDKTLKFKILQNSNMTTKTQNVTEVKNP